MKAQDSFVTPRTAYPVTQCQAPEGPNPKYTIPLNPWMKVNCLHLFRVYVTFGGLMSDKRRVWLLYVESLFPPSAWSRYTCLEIILH